MLGTSAKVIIDNVILREMVGSNLINRTRFLGATGSTITGHPWENRLQTDRFPMGLATSSGPTHALGRVSANLQATHEQSNQQQLPRRRLTDNQTEDGGGRYAKGRGAEGPTSCLEARTQDTSTYR